MTASEVAQVIVPARANGDGLAVVRGREIEQAIASEAGPALAHE